MASTAPRPSEPRPPDSARRAAESRTSQAALRPAWVDVDLARAGAQPGGDPAARRRRAPDHGGGQGGRLRPWRRRRLARPRGRRGRLARRGPARGGGRDPPRRRRAADPGARARPGRQDRPLPPLSADAHRLHPRRAGALARLGRRPERAAADPSQGRHRHGPPRRGHRRGAAGAGDPPRASAAAARRPALPLRRGRRPGEPAQPAPGGALRRGARAAHPGRARRHAGPHGEQRRRAAPRRRAATPWCASASRSTGSIRSLRRQIARTTCGR